ncbi:MAG: hypothetical protein EOO20_10510 [Chryseobacterium sp.]|nr:MAG: hypothetical protein EOO20_10510 [Chryseobacterium sp.]
MEILAAISPEGQDIQVDYAITPTLLNAYLRFKDADDDETFESLINKINGVKGDQVDAILKGIAFEKLVNDLIDGNKDDIEVSDDNQFYIVNWKGDDEERLLFNAKLVNGIAERLKFNTGKQEYMEVVIHSHVGNIKLYGIVDYDYPEMVVDLKGTEKYKCGKFEDNTQHPVYSLIRKLNNKPIKAFKYLVSDYTREYQETYIPTEQMYQKLMFTIYEFIAFINHFKKHITNTKIFGGTE